MATLEQELLADFADSGDEDVADLENDFAGGDFGSPDAGDDEDENMVDEEADYAEKEGKKKERESRMVAPIQEHPIQSPAAFFSPEGHLQSKGRAVCLVLLLLLQPSVNRRG